MFIEIILRKQYCQTRDHNADRCWILQPEDKDAAALGRWFALSHTYAEVKEVIVSELWSPKVNARVNEVIEFWERDLLSDLKKQTEKSDIEQMVALYHCVFNDVFFSGDLAHNRCEVRWRDNLRRIRGWTKDMRQHASWGKLGEGCDEGEQECIDYEEDEIFLNTDDRTDNDEKMCQLGMHFSARMRDEIKGIIEICRRPDIINRQDRLRCYLETLLHEIIHAFLNIATCLCSKFSYDIPRAIGHTDHDLPWHKISDSMESFANSNLNLELDLKRRASLAIEIQASGLEMRDQFKTYLLEDLNLGPIIIQNNTKKGTHTSINKSS